MDDMIEGNIWAAYFCALVGPFVQEDAAVLAAASGSVSKMINTPLMFLVVTTGLVASDLWKYWIGRAAISNQWAKKYVKGPRIEAARGKLGHHLGKNMLISRFMPGARIPLYIAAGFFQISFARFSALIILTALVYIGTAFLFFHVISMVVGGFSRLVIPVLGISLILIAIWASIRTKRKLNADKNL